MLLRPLGISPTRIHRIQGELSPDAAATMAATDLRAVAGVTSGGQPVLDWVFLGMGEDGHVASPGQSGKLSLGCAVAVSVAASVAKKNEARRRDDFMRVESG